MRPATPRAVHSVRPIGATSRAASHRPAYVAPRVASHGARPDARVSYRPSRTVYAPPHRSSDHRYSRPHYRVVRSHPSARYRAPARTYYRPYYTRWYQHPYYRYRYSTSVVVNFGFNCNPWSQLWAPPTRAGWYWVPGHFMGATWWPGHWAPVAAPPSRYVYVTGFWDQDVYIDGFYRPDRRDDGGDWKWMEGYYLDDGTFVRGHWQPQGDPPREGYVWEPGFWDGETWVDGFWRPEFRSSFTWVSAFYDEDGVFSAGYWAPQAQEAGFVWVPGWFDGNAWVEGYWVDSGEYAAEDVQGWEPAEGWDDGWEEGDIIGADGVEQSGWLEFDDGALPLGLPIEIPNEDLRDYPDY